MRANADKKRAIKVAIVGEISKWLETGCFVNNSPLIILFIFLKLFLM